MATYTKRAIARHGSTSNASAAAGTAVTINLPASIPAGALIFAVVHAPGSMDITGGNVPSGFTRLRRTQDTTSTVTSSVYFYKIATGSEGASVSCTMSASLDWVAISSVYTGTTESSTITTLAIGESAGTVESSVGGDTTLATQSVTNTDADAWWIATFAATATTSWTASAGAERADLQSSGATKVTGSLYDSNGTFATGATAITGTSGSASSKTAYLFVIRPGKGGDITAESVGSVDSASKSVSKTLSDSLPITDTIARSFQRGLSDSLGITDSSSRELSYLRTVSDSAGLVDSSELSKSSTHSLSPSDSAGLLDSLAKSFSAEIVDSEALTDSSDKSITKTVSESNPLGLTDSISRSRERSFSDVLGMSDSSELLKQIIQTADDSAGLTDKLQIFKALLLLDSAGLSDLTQFNRSQLFSDNLGLDDTDFFGPFSELRIAGSGPGGMTYHLIVADGMDVTSVPSAAGETHRVTITDRMRIRERASRAHSDLSPIDRLRLRDSVQISLMSATIAKRDRMRIREEVAIELITLDTAFRSVGYLRRQPL